MSSPLPGGSGKARRGRDSEGQDEIDHQSSNHFEDPLMNSRSFATESSSNLVPHYSTDQQQQHLLQPDSVGGGERLSSVYETYLNFDENYKTPDHRSLRQNSFNENQSGAQLDYDQESKLKQGCNEFEGGDNGKTSDLTSYEMIKQDSTDSTRSFTRLTTEEDNETNELKGVELTSSKTRRLKSSSPPQLFINTNTTNNTNDSHNLGWYLHESPAYAMSPLPDSPPLISSPKNHPSVTGHVPSSNPGFDETESPRMNNGNRFGERNYSNAFQELDHDHQPIASTSRRKIDEEMPPTPISADILNQHQHQRQRRNRLPLRRKSTMKESIANGLKSISDRVVKITNNDAIEDHHGFYPKDQQGFNTTLTRKHHPHLRLNSDDTFKSSRFESSSGRGNDDYDDDYEESDEVKYQKAFQRLRGRSLGIFGPEHWLRRWCAAMLVWKYTEPTILLLIFASVVIFTIQAAPNVYTYPRPAFGYFHGWESWALLIIFSIFTFEMIIRIITTGLFFNPPAPETFSVRIRGPVYEPSPLNLSRSRSITSPSSPARSPVRDPYAPLATPTGDTSIVSAVKRQINKQGGLSPLATKSPRSVSAAYPPSPITRDFTIRRRGSTSNRSPNPSPDRSNPSPQLQHATEFVDSVEDKEDYKKGFENSDTTFPPTLLNQSKHPGPAENTSRSSTLPRVHAPFSSSIERSREIFYTRAYLRHSWNRVDCVAIISFWVAFILLLSGVNLSNGVYFFQAMSVLRSMRLLNITTGTNTILYSLKRASPQLVQVGFFVAFAMLLFSIIGVQSFRESYSRTCRWIDPFGQLPSVDLAPQRCGGYINATTGVAENALFSDGTPGFDKPKGFLCAPPSVCIDAANPNNGASSFDNIFVSLYQIVIIASANTFTGTMYKMMDADYFIACIFFIVGLIILNYWLWNLFAAVIMSSFAALQEQTKRSAFSSQIDQKTSATNSGKVNDGGAGVPSVPTRGFNRSASWVAYAYRKTALFWVALALASICLQAVTSFDMAPSKLKIFSIAEAYITLAFGIEIFIRFYATLPDWRSFFFEERNLLDSVLVIATAIIQIPVIKSSEVYPWLTGFQIARFYRVIIAIPRMNRLLSRLRGILKGLCNMVLFLMLMNFLASMIAIQLFRGVPNQATSTPMTLYQPYNAFLSMYQILSSENWTDVVNNVVGSEVGVFRIAVALVFFSAWLFFGYFILMNMFIAAINENFSIPEEEKRRLQREAFERRFDEPVRKKRWWHKWEPYKFPRSVVAAPASAAFQLARPISNADLRDPEPALRQDHPKRQSSASFSETVFDKAKRVLGRGESEHRDQENVALNESGAADETHVYQGTLFPLQSQAERDVDFRLEKAREQRNRLAVYIAEHPSYDKSLWIFSNTNPVRRFCQKLVEPRYGGERLNGQAAVPLYRLAFQTIVFAAIVASVVVAAIATPLYRRNYWLENGTLGFTWFTLVEFGLASIFLTEFLVKIIADGFLWSPNAYMLSAFNIIDLFILLTIITNFLTALIAGPALNHFTRALKAFRALRLISLSRSLRETFSNVLISGFSRIFDAALLALLYLVPYAVWSKNIFGGLLYFCNDGSVSFMNQCAGEYLNSAVSDWNFLMPRVWDNPQTNPSAWNFDDFRASLLILFEIISLEGWIDVLRSIMQISGINEQPVANSFQWAGLFFVLFNLIGAVFILTVFISSIIENFTVRSGTAFLTTEQQAWRNLSKLIMRSRPSKRPSRKPSSKFRRWCFDRATQKHGWWSRTFTGLYCFIVIVLCTQATTNPVWVEEFRNLTFFILTIFLIIDIIVRMYGLGWLNFLKNGWNQYDILVVAGVFATTVAILFFNPLQHTVRQLQKLFLVMLAFKLVQRNNSLNQLFKTSVASLPAIMNIFALWLVLYLVWALLCAEVLGLARWQFAQQHNSNYSSFVKAMVLLFLQSAGEGWNAFMHDYMTDWPQCTMSFNYLKSDCGNAPWAIFLFISWNILSMYLMANLILGAVVENFSYVIESWGTVNYPDRDQMRKFKRVWSDIDIDRSGFIRRRDIPKFFARLVGVFEVRIYRAEWSVKSIRNAASIPSYLQESDSSSLRGMARIDKDAESMSTFHLAHAIRAIDQNEVRQRKYLYNRLYHEAMIDAEQDVRGISFTGMLTLLAHYRLINDEEALQVDELVDRRHKQARVMERVNSESVLSLFQMLALRRQFRRHLESKRGAQTRTLVVPSARSGGNHNSTASSISPQIRVQTPSTPPSTSEAGGQRRRLTIVTSSLPSMSETNDWSAVDRQTGLTRRRGSSAEGKEFDHGSEVGRN